MKPALTRSRTYRRPRRTAERPRHQPRRGHTALFAVLAFAMVVGFGLLYVGQVNTVATSGLAMKNLERSIRELQRENQDLDLRAAALRSLSTVEQSSQALRLQVRAKIEYLPSTPETVARSQ